MEPHILLAGSNNSRALYDCAVLAAGGVPHSFYCPPLDVGYDGLILCGGDDIDPARFAQENRGSVDVDLARDETEFALAEAYLAAGKPILGICRGHQLLNVALGGTLIQDISPELKYFHTPIQDGPDKVHPVRASEGSVLYGLFGSCFQVNSYHHQIVDRLGDGLEAVQWSESGIVEGMEHKSLPVLCLQFHPERMTGQRLRPDAIDGGVILNWFVARCGGGQVGG